MAATPQPPRVILVDDHPAMLRQVAELLDGQFEVLAALRDGGQLEAAAAAVKPDLIVLDIALPGLSGIDLARRLADAGSLARIVFLTVHADADYAREALAAGGMGYVVKPRLASDLLPALRAAQEGRRFISPCREFEGLEGFTPAAVTDGGTP